MGGLTKLPIWIAYFWGIIWGSSPLYAYSLLVTAQVDYQPFALHTRVEPEHQWSNRNRLQKLSQSTADETQSPKRADGNDGDGNDSDGNETTLKPFDETVEGLEKQTGLFTVYRKPTTGQIYLAIQPEQLNQNILLSPPWKLELGKLVYLRLASQ